MRGHDDRHHPARRTRSRRPRAHCGRTGPAGPDRPCPKRNHLRSHPRATVVLCVGRGRAAVEGPVELPDTGPATPFTHLTEFASGGERHLGGNVVYRAERLRAIGGYDERYYDPRRKLHFREDTDLHFRLDAAALTIEFDPELVISHPAHPASFSTPMRLARRYYFDPLLSREHPDAFRAFNAGHRITLEGLRGSEFYVIARGRARVVADGRRVAELGPGDFFGELAVLGDGMRSATVEAETPLRCLVLPNNGLEELLVRHPRLGVKRLGVKRCG